MTDTPLESDVHGEMDGPRHPAGDGENESSSGNAAQEGGTSSTLGTRSISTSEETSTSVVDIVVYLPIGLASLARGAIERLIAESIEQGEVEVSRVRNALENEIEIARSVGRARVRKVLGRSASRFEYPPLSIAAGLVRAIAERGREALEDLQSVARVGKTPGAGEGGTGSEFERNSDAASEKSGNKEELRGIGLATLKTAQRAAASRVLKARFEGRSDTSLRSDSGGGEVLRVTFADEFEDEAEEMSDERKTENGQAAPSEKPLEAISPPTSISDYESLSAQQVVARLGGLSKEELEEVLKYESATKSRAAVIEKIRQELSSKSAS